MNAKTNNFLKLSWLALILVLLAFGIYLFVGGRTNPSGKNSDVARTVREAMANPVQYATNAFRGGIGAVLGVDSATGLAKVMSVIPESPAESAGLRKDDQIVEINGKSMQGQKLAQVVEQLRGYTFSSVSIVVKRDGTNLNCVLSRASWNKLRELGHFQ